MDTTDKKPETHVQSHVMHIETRSHGDKPWLLLQVKKIANGYFGLLFGKVWHLNPEHTFEFCAELYAFKAR